MLSNELPWNEIDPIIDRALQEDIGKIDITTDYLIPDDTIIEAEWVAKEPCHIAGLPLVDRILHKMDSQIKCFWMVKDSDFLTPGKFGLVKGSARGILKCERTALNFLQRLSGIAALTAAYVAKTQKEGTKIYDTRKTTPTLRILEKYAVRMGGGFNHRMGLDEMVLIKENHKNILEDLGFQDWRSLIKKIRDDHPGIQMGCEVENLGEIDRAVVAGADFILLDNMSVDQVTECVKKWKGKVLLEASGSIHLQNVEAYARTGVDRISIGALTHSVKAIDISLEVLGVR